MSKQEKMHNFNNLNTSKENEQEKNKAYIARETHNMDVIQAKLDSRTLSHKDVMQLQKTVGNRTTMELLKNYMNTSSMQKKKDNINKSNASNNQAICQRIIITSVNEEGIEDPETVWDNIISIDYFDGRGIEKDDISWMHKEIKRIPKDERFEHYEDVADELIQRLNKHLGKSYPIGNLESEKDESPLRTSGPGKVMWNLLRYLTMYLAVNSLIPTAHAAPSSSTIESKNGLCPPDDLSTQFALICPLDQLCAHNTHSAPLYRKLQHVSCAEDVRELCTTKRSNPAYNEILEMVDKQCLSITISSPRRSSGACRYKDHPSSERSGSITCNHPDSYVLTQIGHELEHAKDSCSMQKNSGIGLSRNTGGIKSEINAHTRQAAIAKMEMLQGNPVSARDRDLVRSFDLGNPEPLNKDRIDVQDNLWNIVHTYHKLYLGEDLSLKDLKEQYRNKIKKANEEYKKKIKG